MAAGMFDSYTHTFSGSFQNGVTPEEVNEAIWNGDYTFDEDDLRDRFAKTTATHNNING
jgi:hypothetical protein